MSTTVDERALRASLDRIVADPDPVRANRAITAAHHELGELLARELGPDTGANFHTWAVWGSKEAGTTIGRRDVRGLTAVSAVVAAVAGAGLGWLLTLIGGGLGLMADATPLVVTTAAVVAVATAVTTRRLLDRARHHISHGNRIVLDEIGGVTARYLTSCGGEAGRDTEAWLAFAAMLRPGDTEDGGQQALREAFACYHAARFEPDRDTRHQLVFAGNCLAVRHEHVRLQHDIASSMPRLLRRWITRSLLDFWVGAEHLHVGRDLPPLDARQHPPTLRRLTVATAVRIDAEMRQPDRRPGAAARSWASFDDRMHFVVELFRNRHLSPEVGRAPFGTPTDVLGA